MPNEGKIKWDDLSKPLQSDIATSGASSQTVYNLQREVANLKAVSTISNRVDGASGFIFDLNDGLNGGSIGKIDLSTTNSNQALPIGTTVLTDKVPSNPFLLGQEVTVFDDVNLERPTVIRSETTTVTGTNTVTSPTTVVASAYDTSGSGGRKLVRLNSGNLYAAMRNGTTDFRVYKSTDNGTTWTPLVTVTESVNDVSLATNGTQIYVLSSFSTTGTKFRRYDESGVLQGTVTDVDTGQTAMGNCSQAISNARTELYAVWSSKNATYPNSFNIRYAKGTIAGDGTVTWAASEQRSAQNTTGNDFGSPSIVVKNDGNPLFVAQYKVGTTNNKISLFYYNGSTWVVNTDVYDGLTFTQQSPSAVVSPNGNIHVSWYGVDGTDTTPNNIRYSKSTDGGTTWSAMLKLTSGNTYTQFSPSITADKNNNVYVVWDGIDSAISTTYRNMRRITWNGSSWSAITTLTSNTTMGVNSASTLSNYTDFTDPLMIYADTQVVGVKFRGTWVTQTASFNLEITALTKAFKSGATICRSSVVQDTTNKLLKFGGWSSAVTFAVTSPTTVAASAYDTSGNSGRKLVRLNSGNLYAAMRNGGTEFRIYKSVNSGSTWTLLVTVTESMNEVVLATDGNQLYALSSLGAAGLKFRRYDELGLLQGSVIDVDTGQTVIAAACSLTVNSAGTEIHAAWSSKNATYPNSYNIRYAKGTIAGNGTVTWSAVTAIFPDATTGNDSTNPSIVVKGNGYPTIIYSQTTASNRLIEAANWNGSAWSGVVVYNSLSASYAQQSPSAVVSPDGTLHVAWYGQDATDTTTNNIRYSKSTDGGVTWSAMTKLTSGNVNGQFDPSITADKNNNIYIVWFGVDTGTNPRQIRRIIWSGTAWGSITALTNNTTQETRVPSTLSNYADFTDPLMIYMDVQVVGVKFRGTWNIGGVAPVLVEDVRYNITPPSNVSSIVVWVDHDADVNYSIDGAASFQANGGNESYSALTKTTVAIDGTHNEDQFVGSGTANAKATLRLTLTRNNTSLVKNIQDIMGAVGA